MDIHLLKKEQILGSGELGHLDRGVGAGAEWNERGVGNVFVIH